MTAPAERIKEAHRGYRIAEPASRSRLAALDSFGLRYVRVDDFNVVVEGGYHLNLAMSFWRSDDGAVQGYLVSSLAAEIRLQRLAADVPAGTSVLMIDPFNSNPAGGRDSVAASSALSDSGRHAIAESPVGAVSSSLLPVVSP
jgi:hypothetical protein